MSEIRAKEFMVVDFSSFGGGYMAYRLLLDNDIDPRHAPSSFVEGLTHENVVLAVANGLVDVGTVPTGTLEEMAEKGRIRMEDFRVIHRVDDDFPFVHSTRFYPEWPMVALAHINHKQAMVMRRALVAMKASSPATSHAGVAIAGWRDSTSYATVQKLVQMIGQSLQ